MSGTVTDVQLDVVPGAAVTLEGPSAGDHLQATTNENGYFSFSAVKAATSYKVKIHATGFADYASAEIRLTPGQVLSLGDIALKLSAVETTVTAVLPEQLAHEQVKAEEQQRVLGVIPNFYTVYDHNAVPLTAKLKFDLAFRASTDVATITGSAFAAAINQASDGTPNYGQGWGAYGQRFGAGYADAVTGILIGGAILPAVLHQDPRYFYQGTGTNKSRAMHAIATPFIAKGDNGKWQPNYSAVGGDLISGALSNLYYPESDRGAGLVFRGTLIAVGGRMTNALAQEFILKRLTAHAPKAK